MRTFKYITLLATFLVIMPTGGCKKEVLPPVRCFSVGGSFQFPQQNFPIDSIVLILRNGPDYTESQRILWDNRTSWFDFTTEGCGLFKYEVALYDDDPNASVYVELSSDNKYFRSTKLANGEKIEGTYAYR